MNNDIAPTGKLRIGLNYQNFGLVGDQWRIAASGGAGLHYRISDHELVPHFTRAFADGADVAETSYRPFGKKGNACRLIVRRVKPTPGSQLALLATYAYHPFITDRDGGTVALEADHRGHAEVENAIRDLKYGVGLNHLPSGRFGANAGSRST